MGGGSVAGRVRRRMCLSMRVSSPSLCESV